MCCILIHVIKSINTFKLHWIYNFERRFLRHHYYVPTGTEFVWLMPQSRREEILHFHYMTYMTMAQYKNSCPKGHKIYNFGRPFLGHHYYILSLSDLCMGADKKIFKEIMHFHYTGMSYLTTAQHKNPCPKGDRFLVISTIRMYLIVWSMPGSRQEFFKEIMHIYYMTHLAMSQHKILCPRVHEIYNFGRYLLVYRYYILNLSEPCFFYK